jgi:type I restriction enzyme, R subunit
MDNLNFDETKQSQLPLAEMLINMGYRYISRAEVMAERRGDTSAFILRDTAIKKFAEINHYEHKGNTYKFSEKDIAEVVDELENIPLEGLIDTSKKVYGMIMPKTGGKTIKVFHDGSIESKSFRYIDFEEPENNDFAVTVEFDATGRSTIRVDIVIFVNGMPFALIENKKSSVEIEEALSQHNRNQNISYCPKLFVYPQLLIGANKDNLLYGTTGTPNKFFAKWKERELIEEEWKHREAFKKVLEQQVKEIISKPIDQELYTQILTDLNGSTYRHIQVTNRFVTSQDLATLGLLAKDRLLDVAKNFTLYDAGVKKIMRYQQYFAIKKMSLRTEQIEAHKYGNKRRGGILWHTQGSGKSLTMVLFVKALIENPDINNPRVIIVTDRKDLDRQIKGTFTNAGLKKDVIQASSGEHLIQLIKQQDLRVITTLVHKFQSASNKRAGFVDSDANIFVLIDEAHRSQGGDANLEMNRVIPNACYIAFTGTPLLKKDKSKLKFGRFIDRYTIDDALEDEIILPLIYEGRYVDLIQDKKEIDKQSDRLTKEMNIADRSKLQYQVKKQIIQDNPQRINEIAYDIEEHFLKQLTGSGLKAQIVAPSKYSACLFQKYFAESGKINTALVISDDNGIIDEKDDHKKEVDDYLKEIKAKYQSLLSYEKEVIDSFKYNDEGVEILIVVDKLLTGFDAPRNTVLYLAKELQDHNLLQAIARVNRLYDNEALPKTAGFIIDYSENAYNLKTAMQLFGNYDEEDVKGTLIDVEDKIHELEKTYSELHDLFNGIDTDDEAYLQFLSDNPTRQKFYDHLNTFLKVFSECMVLEEFVHEFDHIDTYRLELKKFMNLRKTANLRYAEQVDFKKYKLALIKIMDSNIKAEEVELLTRQISINDKEVFEDALASLGSDKSKAEAIAAQMSRTVKELMDKDPEYYERFSQKISKLIEEMRQKNWLISKRLNGHDSCRMKY